MADKKPVVVNYTPEMTAVMRAAYVAAPNKDTVAALAAQFGKTTKSIVAKLSREGVYVKAAYVTKVGTAPMLKDAMVTMIAGLIGENDEKLDGLEKAPKAALALIANALKAKRDGNPADAASADEGEASE